MKAQQQQQEKVFCGLPVAEMLIMNKDHVQKALSPSSSASPTLTDAPPACIQILGPGCRRTALCEGVEVEVRWPRAGETIVASVADGFTISLMLNDIARTRRNSETVSACARDVEKQRNSFGVCARCRTANNGSDEPPIYQATSRRSIKWRKHCGE